MKITINEIDNKTIQMELDGKFNIEEVRNFDEEFFNLINKSYKTINLNLKNLKYIDSSGVGALIKALNVSKKSEKEFILFDISDDLLKILKQIYIDKFFTIKYTKTT